MLKKNVSPKDIKEKLNTKDIVNIMADEGILKKMLIFTKRNQV
jgi:hypothetical protein